MRSYQFPKTGSVDDLVLVEGDVPAPARGQVKVRMKAASLNYRDHMVASGRYGGKPPANLVPLSDGAGEVVAIGPDVTRVQVGDRVAGCFFQTWSGGTMAPVDHANALGGSVDGVLAEERLFDQNGLVHLPEHLSYQEGATLPCAALTAWNALFQGQALVPGETVLVLGTGGVSIFALQFAKAAGARVIATSSSDAKLERVRELGADLTVNYATTPEWDKEVWQLTGKRGVDHVVEVGGGGTLLRSIAATRLGGAVHLIGVLTGGQVDPTPILMKSVVVRGIYVGSRDMFEIMNRAISRHQIRPVIDQVFPFDAAADAYRHLASGSHLGKVVIEIG